MASHEIETEDHDPVVTSMKGVLENFSSLSPDRCIYRVPTKLRRLKEEAYTPLVVSIGPLHCGKECLQAMEEHKSRYLPYFLDRYKIRMEDCVKAIRKLEAKASNCYAEKINLSIDEFVKMILVDGAFIIVVLLRYNFPRLPDEDNYIYNRPCMIHEVRRDMTLIENQLPFFVLENLLSLVPHQHDIPSLLELAYNYFKEFVDMDDIVLKTISNSEVKHTDQEEDSEVEHFTGFLRLCQRPSLSLRSRDGKDNYGFIPNARKLEGAGLKLKMGSSKRLLHIQYTPGSLEIPKLKIKDRTESFFRNLIAFELCHHQPDTYIADYIYFMDSLINSPADVDLLVENGIIDSWLGNNAAVATLFNSLLTEATVWRGNFYYANISKDLKAYCKSPWHGWLATLKRDYFGTPWRGFSTIAAVILLILTLIQTICSVKD